MSADGPRWKTAADVRSDYADLAHWMDRFHVVDRLLTGRARARLFGDARGRVLDVACGTGTNCRYLPADATYVGVDLSPAMLDRAADRTAEGDREATLFEMDAAALGFADDSFDAVISSLSTCTFPDPGGALAEMARVCRPEGRIRLLEHGRSSVRPLARLQDWRAASHYERIGCRLNQEPLALVEGTGLAVESVRRGLLGTLTAMIVRPT